MDTISIMFYGKDRPSVIDELRDIYGEYIEPYKLRGICKEYDIACIRLYKWLEETDDNGKLKNNYKKLKFSDWNMETKKQNLKALKSIFKTGKKVGDK